MRWEKTVAPLVLRSRTALQRVHNHNPDLHPVTYESTLVFAQIGGWHKYDSRVLGARSDAKKWFSSSSPRNSAVDSSPESNGSTNDFSFGDAGEVDIESHQKVHGSANCRDTSASYSAEKKTPNSANNDGEKKVQGSEKLRGPAPSRLPLSPEKLLELSKPLTHRHKVSVSDDELVQAREAASLIKNAHAKRDKGALALSKHELITRRRIPPNFVKEVLIPHLEKFIWNARECNPMYLIELAVAYSQMPVINSTIAYQLSNGIIHRLEDFNGPEFAKLLLPLYKMRPKDEKLFALLSIELEEHFLELSTLNLIAVVRILGRLRQNDQQENFLEKMVIPRLQMDIARYDAEELSSLLIALAATPRMNVQGDIPLMAAIIPQLEKRYDETPLLTALINMNALCRLRLFHKRLLSLTTHDLSNRYKIRNLPPKYLSMAAWTWARYGFLQHLLPALEPQIEERAAEFNAREYARLCQALPFSSENTLHKITFALMERLVDMSTDHFCFFFLGLARRGYLPTETGVLPDVGVDPMLGSSPRPERSEFFSLETDEPNLTDAEGHLADLDEKLSNQQAEEADDTATKWNEPVTSDQKAVLHVQDAGSEDCSDNCEKAADTLERSKEGIIMREHFLNECLKFMTVYEDSFSEEEIQRLCHILLHSNRMQYAFISKMLPLSWEEIVREVMACGK